MARLQVKHKSDRACPSLLIVWKIRHSFSWLLLLRSSLLGHNCTNHFSKFGGADGAKVLRFRAELGNVPELVAVVAANVSSTVSVYIHGIWSRGEARLSGSSGDRWSSKLELAGGGGGGGPFSRGGVQTPEPEGKV